MKGPDWDYYLTDWVLVSAICLSPSASSSAASGEWSAAAAAIELSVTWKQGRTDIWGESDTCKMGTWWRRVQERERKQQQQQKLTMQLPTYYSTYVGRQVHLRNLPSVRIAVSIYIYWSWKLFSHLHKPGAVWQCEALHIAKCNKSSYLPFNCKAVIEAGNVLLQLSHQCQYGGLFGMICLHVAQKMRSSE